MIERDSFPHALLDASIATLSLEALLVESITDWKRPVVRLPGLDRLNWQERWGPTFVTSIVKSYVFLRHEELRPYILAYESIIFSVSFAIRSYFGPAPDGNK